MPAASVSVKVVHFSQSHSGNGAGAAAYRLHHAMLELGLDSSMVSGLSGRNDGTVFAGGGNCVSRHVVPYANAFVARRAGARRLFSSGLLSYGRINRHLVEDADAVVLHWITGGFLAPRQLQALRPPVYWRLSDIWAFSGGCHFPGECVRYESACGSCPALGSRRELDLSQLEWRAKRRAYESLDLTIVAPSRWIAECARRSSLFRDRRVVHIPTGVDIHRFQPLEKEQARAALGLPADRRIVLFGALRSTEDPRKGYRHLRAALRHLTGQPESRDWHLTVFGGPTQPPAGEDGALGFSASWIGRLHDEASLALLYSAADVMVAPFLEDNLPNVVVEAAACGLPVVAFDAGGLPDIVEHLRTGWLAPLRDDQALAAGIAWVLADERRRRDLAAAARSRIEATFALESCAWKWKELMANAPMRARPSGKP